jgi:two-component system, sensor histidine kinase and response regulator
VQLELDLQCPPDLGDRLSPFTVALTPHSRFNADERRVQQVLSNLLSNAVKFTPSGGKVILRLWQEGNHLVLQVEDTGIGIPEHQRHLLFQKFQQLDPSYHRKYEGTGLGLALTKQLVELHGGWIEVESTVGVGSTFTVRLPSHPLPSTALANNHLVNLSHLSGRVVLIEHEEESALLMCDLLNAAGYQVVWLMDGLTALKQMEFLQPVLVITSSDLPDMDGMEVIHSLYQSPVTQNVQTLALLKNNIPLDQVQAIAATASDYLIKPVKPEQLLDKVTTLIGRVAADLPAVS